MGTTTAAPRYLPAVVVLALVMLSCAAGLSTRAAADTGPLDLGGMLIGEAELSTRETPFSLVSTGPLDVRTVVAPDVAQVDELTQKVLQGRAALFESSSAGVRVVVGVVEFTTRYWADGIRLEGNREPTPELPAGTHLRVERHDGRPVTAVNATKGRLLTIVRVESLTPDVADDTQLRFAAEALAAQLTRLPALPDLPVEVPVTLQALRWTMTFLPIMIVPLVATVAAGISMFTDRTEIDRWLRRRNAPTPRRPDSGVQDLSASTAQRRRSARIRILSAVFGAAVLSGLLSWLQPKVSLSALFLVASVPASVILVVYLDLLIGRKDDPRPIARTVLPAGASWLFRPFGLLCLAWFFTIGYSTIVFLTRSALYLLLVAMVAVITYRLVIKAMRPSDSVRRQAKEQAKHALTGDRRAPVILVRSFQDDDLLVRVRRSLQRNLIEWACTDTHTPFQGVAAWSLWRYGPVTVLDQRGGRQHTLVPALDAAVSVQDRPAMVSLLRCARLTVVVVGRSPVLTSVVSAVRELGLLDTCLFVFPPVDEFELRARVHVLADALEIDPQPLDTLASEQCLVGMYFSDSGFPIPVCADGYGHVTYQMLYERVGERIHERDRLFMSAPATTFEASERGDLLVRDPIKEAGVQPPGPVANFAYFVRCVAARRRTSDGASDIEAVSRARADIYRLIQQGRHGAIHDRHLTPKARRETPRWQWIEGARAAVAERDFSGPERVSVLVNGRVATVSIEAYDGTPTSPQRFVRIRERWLADPR